MSKSAKERLAALPPAARREWLAAQPDEIVRAIRNGVWWFERRPEQAPPPGDWFLWLILSGRGWGKTRTGAEWIIEQAFKHPRDRHGNPTDWLVIGESLSDTRTFCIDGPSGVRNVLRRRGLTEVRATDARTGQYRYVRSPKPLIALPDQQKIYFEGCDDEDTGRGYNAAGCWLDELAKWRYTHKVWVEGIMPSIRADLVDDNPRVVVTTTPKPIMLLKDWAKRAKAGDAAYRLTVAATFDNASNLSPHALSELTREYAGTTVGRQELHGELLEEAEGALWNFATIDKYRVTRHPDLTLVVVGMDPPGTGLGDECGLVCIGRGVDDDDYVLADWSGRVAGRNAAVRAWTMFQDHGANLLIYEDNFGKKWLEAVLTDAYRELQNKGLFSMENVTPPMRGVTALQGKRLRAEPYAMRYEQGRVHHVGGFPDLEDQMVGWVPMEQVDSPDRIDALVHAGMWIRGRERRRASLAVPDYGSSGPGTGLVPTSAYEGSGAGGSGYDSPDSMYG